MSATRFTRRSLPEGAGGGLAVGGQQRLVALGLQLDAQQEEDVGFVVDDQNFGDALHLCTSWTCGTSARFGDAGRPTWKAAPPPGRSVILMCPPCRSMSVLTR